MTSLSTTFPMPEPVFHVEEGSYRTAPRQISWLARKFPNLVFYAKYTSIVLRAATKAKFSKYDSQAWVKSSLEVLHALESVGVEFEVTGMEQLAAVDGPCLIVGNHMGTLETMILPSIIQPIREVTFVVKQALVTYPIFKHVMLSRDPIAVSQTNVRADLKLMLAGGLERLAKGVSLVIFPQGQRSADFQPRRFNSIGVKLASRAGVPIIPLALLTDTWPLGMTISDFGTIDPSKKAHFAFGAPLFVKGRGAEENQAIIEFIESHLRQWRPESS